MKILLEIQSENKLQKIFNNGNFDATRILRHSIASSLQAMLQVFRNNCIQYNPHIHYMQPNPLARVALTQLMTRIVEMLHQRPGQTFQTADDDDGDGDGGDDGVVVGIRKAQHQKKTNNDSNRDNNKQPATVVRAADGGKSTAASSCCIGDVDNANGSGVGIGIGIGIGIGNIIAVTNNDGFLLPITTDTINTTIQLCEAVIALMENIKQIEVTALIYIESKFIDKFLSEHLLRPEHVLILVRFIGCCCQCIKAIFDRPSPVSLTHEERNCVSVCLQCIDVLLHQKFIWYALNQQQQQQQQKQPSVVKTVPNSSGKGKGKGVIGGVGGAAVGETIDSCLPLTKCELNKIICLLLDAIVVSVSVLLENTAFFRKYKNALKPSTKCQQQPDCQQHQPHHQHEHEQQNAMNSYENETWLTAAYNSKVTFLAKLIETKVGKNNSCSSEYQTTTTATLFAASTTSSSIDVLDLKGINNQFDFISLVSLNYTPRIYCMH